MVAKSAAPDLLASFHPAVRTWFERRFGAPTDAQRAGWPHIRAARDALLCAPTGSGKTLAAFLAGINSLIRRAEAGTLEAVTDIVYVSPLKALGNDIQRNLETPLEEIRAVAAELGYDLPEITTAVRSGDTTAADRQAIVKRPPHILITTPESLYLMLTAERARQTLRHVRTVIVDEIHALARDKRGSHLALSLARLDHVTMAAGGTRPNRVGLSATQRPIEEIAAFLVGGRARPDGSPGCEVVDLGHQRDLTLSIEVPPADLEAVASAEQWADTYDRLAAIIREHRTTLVFVNTRRLSERVAHHLAQRLGEEHVASHHGSLSKERRLKLEQKLKDGELKALVATASLELGIDIGSIDLVCQVGSPRSIATFLQRVGRSGHALGARPEGRLFPSTRDELVECTALVRAVRAGRLDRIVQPVAPLDVLAQQIVAECACEDWGEDALFDLMRSAHPYRDLRREDYDEIVEMLASGVGEGAGRTTPLIHRDRINGVLRARRGARMVAIQNGGTIPELGDYRVIAEPDETFVGTVNEDFAIESMKGDIFLLGSTSWRIKRVEQSQVRVEDAHGAPPTIPFWLGEAPGRTVELSEEVGRLRSDVEAGLRDTELLRQRLEEDGGLDDHGARQLVDYVRATRDGLGLVPTDHDIVFERFFDESGGMQLVVHAPFGARINRAYGLALRKRFCVTFDFELQAAASDDAILLSLGPQHSFPLEDAFSFVSPRNAKEAVEQSILYTPLFPTRWRWDATRALAIPRQRGGKRVPPFIQRLRADDLLAAVFPAQVGCQENVTGPLEIPDHPLVRQTVEDCLREAMDIDGLLDVLERIEDGSIRLHARDTTEPSPMAHEIVNGRPYTYLDDAPLEERRTRAVTLRRALPTEARELGALDPSAIQLVRDQAWPTPRDPEEVHDALLGFIALRQADIPDWLPALEELATAGRAGRFEHSASGSLPVQGQTADSRPLPLQGETASSHPLSLQGQTADPQPLPLQGETAGSHPLSPQGKTAGPHPFPPQGETAGPHPFPPQGETGSRPLPLQRESANSYPLPLQGEGEGGGAARHTMWFPAEHIEAIRLLYPAADLPHLAVPDAARIAVTEREDARMLLLRGHCEALGPVTPAALAERVALDLGDVGRGLAMLEAGGYVLRGRFTPGLEDEEFCDRRLLARIHRYTLDQLRREIDPVTTRDYMRFLLRWHHVAPGTHMKGRAAVRQAVARLEGFEAAASAWEGELLAARIEDYTPAWLDELCLAGEVAWARLTPRRAAGGGAVTASRVTPMTLALRSDLPVLLEAVRGSEDMSRPAAGAAAELLELLEARGALFFDELVSGTRRLGTDVEQGLRELVACGFVASDGFQGLRQLSGLWRRSGRGRRGTGYLRAAGGPPGRWALVTAPLAGTRDVESLAEEVANVLLQRYGVVFRDVVAQESFTVPWREVLRALRRFEARGTVRGGRFVSGFVGEQYALPEAVEALRRVRKEPLTGERIRVAAVDPLNLTGVLFPGPRTPSVAGRTVDYVDGAPELEPVLVAARS